MSSFQNYLNQRFANKCVVVLGYGVEGKSTAKWLAQVPGILLRIADENSEENAITHRGQDWLQAVEGADFIIRSPGIHPQKILAAGGDLAKVTGQIEEILHFAAHRIIGITGTLGKGSTCAQLDWILTNGRIPHALGGNFGIPAWDIADCEGYLILELSSFQTYLLKSSPAYVGIVETTSEHLDWHENQTDYLAAKANLLRFQKKGDTLVYVGNSLGVQQLVQCSPLEKSLNINLPNEGFYLEGEVLKSKIWELHVKQCTMKGRHQMKNRAVAANLALALGLRGEEIFESLASFKGLPMRLEYRGRFKGIDFYNDSYATRPDATMGAVQSMEAPFSLILGGSEKFADFSEMVECLGKLRLLKGIYLIGQTAERIAEMLKAAKIESFTLCATLEEAFAEAVQRENVLAVLLSPACASFGLFKNYKHRGEVFNELVEKWGQQ